MEKIQKIVSLLNDLNSLQGRREKLLIKRASLWIDYCTNSGKNATKILSQWKKVCGKIQAINDSILYISKSITNEQGQNLSYNHESSYGFASMNLAY